MEMLPWPWPLSGSWWGRTPSTCSPTCPSAMQVGKWWKERLSRWEGLSKTWSRNNLILLQWVNDKLQGAEKSSRVTSFQDSSISTGLPLIDLIDAIKPGCINYELVQQPDSEEVNKTRFFSLLILVSTGKNCKCKVRNINGQEVRGQSICTARGYCRGIFFVLFCKSKAQPQNQLQFPHTLDRPISISI